MKTNIIIKIRHHGMVEKCRVKLDSKKFPYIIVNHEKIIIGHGEFPRTSRVLNLGLGDLEMELIAGKEELQAILNNPDLPVDELSIGQRIRVG